MIHRNLIISFCLVFTYNCSDSNGDSNIMPVAPNEAELLYIQTAETAEMTSASTLEISVARDVFGFTDKPIWASTYLAAYRFASLWNEEGANSFSEYPRYAVLTCLDGEQQHEVALIMNSGTVYSDGGQEDSLVYDVTFEAEKISEAQMSFVSLFVDTETLKYTTLALNQGMPEADLLRTKVGDDLESVVILTAPLTTL
jgi:hypothetical protein